MVTLLEVGRKLVSHICDLAKCKVFVHAISRAVDSPSTGENAL